MRVSLKCLSVYVHVDVERENLMWDSEWKNIFNATTTTKAGGRRHLLIVQPTTTPILLLPEHKT